MPVGAPQEVDEVEPQGVLGLVNLPILQSGALEVFAETVYAIGEGLIGSGASQLAERIERNRERRIL